MISNRSMPSNYVTPVLAYPDVARASKWLCAAFGFSVRLRIKDHRIQLNVGEDCVVVTGAQASAFQAEGAQGLHSIMVRVEDADAHHQLAADQGARILSAPEDFPYGERQYTAEDLAGHRWTFSQSIADVDPADWGGEAVELDP